MSAADLVVVSLEQWDEVWRRNQYLVAGLLRTRPDLRVLFVEPPADPLYALLGGAAARTGRGLRPASRVEGVAADRLWLLQPTKFLPRRVDAHADSRLARAVVRAADRLRMRSPALWVNDPWAAALLDTAGWPALYDVTDDWAAARRPPAEIERLVANERALLDRCCEVTVCSTALEERKRGAAPVTLVTNGVDVARYRTPAPRPLDLPAGRVALYVGTVHRDRFDVEACAAAARLLAGGGGADPAGARGTVVLVGPVSLDDPARSTPCPRTSSTPTC
jgi:teichuronic acid biosynthesis glycosyltransferase TuaH